MNPYQESVKKMMQAFGQATPESPDFDEATYPLQLRAKLILEEADEFACAAGFAMRDDGDDVSGNVYNNRRPWPADPVEMIDAICDLLVVTFGAAVAMGVDLDPFFAEVQRSNFDKTRGPKRQDGKQLKPADWKAPDLASIWFKERAAARSGRAFEQGELK